MKEDILGVLDNEKEDFYKAHLNELRKIVDKDDDSNSALDAFRDHLFVIESQVLDDLEAFRDRLSVIDDQVSDGDIDEYLDIDYLIKLNNSSDFVDDENGCVIGTDAALNACKLMARFIRGHYATIYKKIDVDDLRNKIKGANIDILLSLFSNAIRFKSVGLDYYIDNDGYEINLAILNRSLEYLWKNKLNNYDINQLINVYESDVFDGVDAVLHLYRYMNIYAHRKLLAKLGSKDGMKS